MDNSCKTNGCQKLNRLKPQIKKLRNKLIEAINQIKQDEDFVEFMCGWPLSSLHSDTAYERGTIAGGLERAVQSLEDPSKGYFLCDLEYDQCHAAFIANYEVSNESI